MKWGVNTLRVTHTECEICLWIKAVRRFEGVAFIHLSLAVNYLLAQTHTYSANNQIQSVCQHQGAIVAHLTGKVFFFSALICQADGSIAAIHPEPVKTFSHNSHIDMK